MRLSGHLDNMMCTFCCFFLAVIFIFGFFFSYRLAYFPAGTSISWNSSPNARCHSLMSALADVISIGVNIISIIIIIIISDKSDCKFFPHTSPTMYVYLPDLSIVCSCAPCLSCKSRNSFTTLFAPCSLHSLVRALALALSLLLHVRYLANILPSHSLPGHPLIRCSPNSLSRSRDSNTHTHAHICDLIGILFCMYFQCQCTGRLTQSLDMPRTSCNM